LSSFDRPIVLFIDYQIAKLRKGMKLIAYGKAAPPEGRCLSKTLFIMRLTVVFFLSATLSLSARSFSQNVNLSVKQASLTQVFTIIQEQTGYSFICDQQLLQGKSSVSLRLKNASLTEALDKCLAGSALTYKIDGNIVLITVATNPNPPVTSPSHADTTKTIVKGTVKDGDGKPFQNASISINSTNKGTVTDANGNFTIAASVGQTLMFTSVGYQSVSFKVRSATEMISIVLKISSGHLDDVVVVGVQSQSKRNTTAAISSVLGKDIEDLPVASVDAALQGRVAGMNVQISSGEPGVAPTVVVRGNTKLNTAISGSSGNNVAQAQSLSGPLYVIDGLPVNPEDIANAIDNTGTDFLAGININDIESIDVQKDAAATAAWGSRGANGVVYIKTRRGHSKIPEFRVNAYGGITQQPDLLPTYTGAAERTAKMAIINQYMPSATSAELASLPQMLTDSLNPYFNNATNWQGIFYRSGAIQNVDASMSQAAESVDYRISGNYYNEQGIIDGFGYTRYSLRGNLDFKISPKFNTQIIFAFSEGNRKRGKKFYNNADNNTPVDGPNQPSSLYLLNAFDSANFTTANIRNANVNGLYSISDVSNYKILPSLTFTFQGSAQEATSNRDYFQPAYSNPVQAAQADNVGLGAASYAESDKGSYVTYFMSNSLNFNKKFVTEKNHTHNFVVTASQQFNSDVVNSSTAGGYNVPSNAIQVVTGIPQANLVAYSDHQTDGLLSWIGQLQYDYDGKYLLYGSYRGDASSRFGSDDKWGYFPSLGAGWIISEEKFMNSLKDVISFLKLRASWGISGTQSDNFYAPYNAYNLTGTYSGAPIIQPSYTNGLTKDNLTWTHTEQKNLGLEMQLFNNRLYLSVDAYDKISRDDYFNFTLPFYTGYSQETFNANDLWVSNRGADITFNGKILTQKNRLNWGMQLTLSYNKNALARLPNNNRTFVLSDYYGTNRIFQVGEPIYEMFQLHYAGVYNQQSDIPINPLTGKVITYFKGNHPVQPGDPIWVDVNKIGDVWTGENNGNQYGDQVPSGNPNPKFTGGFINDFSYKNFSLTIVSIFTYKRTIINNFFQTEIGNLTGGYNSSIYQFASARMPDLRGLNYWVPGAAAKNPNYKANFPSINPFESGYYEFIGLSDEFNQDGSYLKVKNIMASYMIPASITKRAKLSHFRVYGIVENLLTFKHTSIPDPEAVDQTGQYTGGAYPLAKKFTLGFDVQF
jgi:TonB-linked SusC/RagA family outer membrane protein